MDAYGIGHNVGKLDWMGQENHQLTSEQLRAKADKEIAFRQSIGSADYLPLELFYQGHTDGYREAQREEEEWQRMRAERIHGHH